MNMKISATKDGGSYINKSSSGLFLGVVFVLLLIGILALSLWVSELSKDSSNVNSKVESRLAILEEQLQLADSTSTEFLSDRPVSRGSPYALPECDRSAAVTVRGHMRK